MTDTLVLEFWLVL